MNTKKKVYAFYIAIIVLAVLAMMVFDLNLMAKSILCLIVFCCLLVMRSIQKAYHMPDDIDPDTMQPIGPVLETEKEDSCARQTIVRTLTCIFIFLLKQMKHSPMIRGLTRCLPAITSS